MNTTIINQPLHSPGGDTLKTKTVVPFLALTLFIGPIKELAGGDSPCLSCSVDLLHFGPA